jgi:ABC-type molybdate transport system ATPase subunit
MIEIDFEKKLGEIDFGINLTVEPLGLTVFFGPSGSGKSSVVNMLSGLLKPDKGRFALNGRVLFDKKNRINVPTYARNIGYVFQDSLLFPHLSVYRNLKYGYKPDRQIRMDEVVDLLGIEHLLKRRPHNLSGGEKQRVAIGRALVTNPDILLMDEPLSALDENRKNEIMPFVERVRDEFQIPIIYVTHSREEVERLATTVIRMDRGKVIAKGTPDQVFRDTRNKDRKMAANQSEPPHDHPSHRHHDMGASEHPAFVLEEHEPSDIDKRVDALVNLLADPAIQCVRPDERRRGIEELDAESYHSFSYYQRWLVGVTNVLLEKGIIGRQELERRLDHLRSSAPEDQDHACGV